MSCEGPVGVRAGDSLTLGVGPVAGEASMRIATNVPMVVFEAMRGRAPLVGALIGAIRSRVLEKRPILFVTKHKQMSHKRFKYQKKVSPELHT